MPRNATLDEDIDRRLRDNQLRLAADLDRTYDIIVCGARTSGSVVVRRLAEDRAVNVFLLEAGGCDDVPSVTEPGRWSTNLGEASDWAFQAEPNPNLGVEAFDNPNGMMLEGRGGAASADNCIRNGKRHSIFRAYTYPLLARPNLTAPSNAFVRRVIISHSRATGVDVALGQVRPFTASAEVVLAAGVFRQLTRCSQHISMY